MGKGRWRGRRGGKERGGRVGDKEGRGKKREGREGGGVSPLRMKILATSLGEVFVFGCLCFFVTILRCLLPVPPVFDLSKAVGVVYPSPAGARAKVKFLGKGSEPPPHQLGGLRQRCKLSRWVRGEAPATQSFSGIWLPI